MAAEATPRNASDGECSGGWALRAQGVSRWRVYFLSLACFLGFALLNTYPLVRHMTTTAPGWGGDAFQAIWNLWWVRHALERGLNPFYTNLLFWPTGTGLYIHSIAVYNAVLTLPVQVLWGPTAAYNVAMLGKLTLNAFGAFLLADYLWKDKRAAFLAGLAFGFNAYMAGHLLGHPRLIGCEFIPLGVLWLLKALQTGRFRYFLLVALAMVVNLMETDLVFFMSIFTGVLLLWQSWAIRKDLRRLRLLWQRGLFAAVLSMLLSLPLLLPLAREVRDNPGTRIPVAVMRFNSADVMAYVRPNPFHPFWGLPPGARGRRPSYSNPPFAGRWAFPGYAVLFLASLAWLGGSRRRAPADSDPFPRAGPAFWGSVALLFALLSLGPDIKFNGRFTGIHTPYILLAALPGFSTLSAPNRFFVMVELSLAVLAAGGFSRLMSPRNGKTAVQSRWTRSLPTFVLAIVLFEDLWIPYPFTRVPPPSGIDRRMAADEETYAVVDVPFVRGDAVSMIAQMTHRKPLLNGYISKPPLSCIPCQCVPPLRPLSFLPFPEPDILPGFDYEVDGIPVLRSFDVRYVIVHRSRLKKRQFRKAERLLETMGLGRPVYQEAGLDVYEVPGATQRRAVVSPVLVEGVGYDPGGWSQPHRLADGTVYRCLQRATHDADMALWATGPTKVTVRFPVWSLAPGFDHPFTVTFRERAVASVRVSAERKQVEMSLPLKRGGTFLTFRGSACIGPISITQP